MQVREENQKGLPHTYVYVLVTSVLEEDMEPTWKK